MTPAHPRAMIESPADRALLFDPAAFGETATWHAPGGNAVLSGIFADPHARLLAEPGVSGLAPSFALAAETAPGIARGQTITLRSALWAIADIHPDGAGLLRLILERA